MVSQDRVRALLAADTRQARANGAARCRAGRRFEGAQSDAWELWQFGSLPKKMFVAQYGEIDAI